MAATPAISYLSYQQLERGEIPTVYSRGLRGR
jgi:hypothetical protein